MILRYFISPPHMRRALALWVILAIAVCIKIARVHDDRSVYPVFVGSAQHWWSDARLYAPYGQLEGRDGYRYSPSFAVALTPLAYLPYGVGAMIWSVASIVILVWALLALMRDVLPPPSAEGWSPWQKRMFLTLTLGGSAVGIWSGQSNALVLALVALGLAAIARGRWWTASLLLAAPVFIKIWPLAIVLLLIACWPRQLTWRFVVACILLAIVPFLTRPPSMVARQYRDWYFCLIGPLQARNEGYRDAWTFWEQFCPLVGCRANWADPISHRIFVSIGLVAALGVLGWCLWQARRTCLVPMLCAGTRVFRRSASAYPTGADAERHTLSVPTQGVGTRVAVAAGSGHLLTLILSIWAAWQLLFGPATEQFTYGIIAPSAAWAVLMSFAEKRARWLTVAAWTLLTLGPAGDIESTLAHVFPASPILAPLGVVLFVAWLVWHERGAKWSPLPLGEG